MSASGREVFSKQNLFISFVTGSNRLKYYGSNQNNQTNHEQIKVNYNESKGEY